MSEKIKVSAPRQNPHICYISREYEQIIDKVKKVTGKTFYRLLCICSNHELNTSEDIKSFKNEVRKCGFKTIGEWAESLLCLLEDNIEDLEQIDLASIKLFKKDSGMETREYDVICD